MAFHRLVAPTYFGGLPSGYDYLNDPANNPVPDPGVPAGVDGKKSSGVNEGSYFNTTTEPANSTNYNRGLSALGDNCDALDDVLRASRPVFAFEDFVSGGDTQIQITDDVFVGRSGVAPITQEERDFLIAVVTTNMKPLLVAGVPVTASDIRDSGDAGNIVGGEVTGYHTNPIVVFSATIPSLTNYRLVYYRRGTVTAESDPVDGTGDMGYTAGLILKALVGGSNSFEMGFTAGGTNWADATNIAALNVRDAIREIVAVLGDDTGPDGAGRIGADAHTAAGNGLISLAQGSTRSQLDELSDAAAAHALAQVISGAWDFQAALTNSLDSVNAMLFTGGNNNGINMQGSTIARLKLGGAGCSSQIRIGDELLFQDQASATVTALNLTNNEWRIGVGLRMDAGEDFYTQSGDSHIGVNRNVNDSYQQRFGRFHSSWSHFREDWVLGGLSLSDFPRWTSAGVAPTTGSNTLDGVLNLTTIASTGSVSVVRPKEANYNAGRRLVAEYIVEINTNTTVIVEVGFSTDPSAPGGGGAMDSCFARFNTDVGDSVFFLVGNANGTVTTSAGSTSVLSATRYRLTLVINPDGSAAMYVNGSEEATIGAGSVGTSVGQMYVRGYCETRANVIRTLSIDKIEVWQDNGI